MIVSSIKNGCLENDSIGVSRVKQSSGFITWQVRLFAIMRSPWMVPPLILFARFSKPTQQTAVQTIRLRSWYSSTRTRTYQTKIKGWGGVIETNRSPDCAEQPIENHVYKKLVDFHKSFWRMITLFQNYTTTMFRSWAINCSCHLRAYNFKGGYICHAQKYTIHCPASQHHPRWYTSPIAWQQLPGQMLGGLSLWTWFHWLKLGPWNPSSWIERVHGSNLYIYIYIFIYYLHTYIVHVKSYK